LLKKKTLRIINYKIFFFFIFLFFFYKPIKINSNFSKNFLNFFFNSNPNFFFFNFLESNNLIVNNFEKNIFSYFFFSFLIKYFQHKSKKNIFFFLKKLSFSNFFFFDHSYDDLLIFLEKKFKKYQTQIGRGFFLKEFFECFIFFLFFKDATFFSN
jgi:hypothetical protein